MMYFDYACKDCGQYLECMICYDLLDYASDDIMDKITPHLEKIIRGLQPPPRTLWQKCLCMRNPDPLPMPKTTPTRVDIIVDHRCVEERRGVGVTVVVDYDPDNGVQSDDPMAVLPLSSALWTHMSITKSMKGTLLTELGLAVSRWAMLNADIILTLPYNMPQEIAAELLTGLTKIARRDICRLDTGNGNLIEEAFAFDLVIAPREFKIECIDKLDRMDFMMMTRKWLSEDRENGICEGRYNNVREIMSWESLNDDIEAEAVFNYSVA